MVRLLLGVVLFAICAGCGSICVLPCGEPLPSTGEAECAVMTECVHLWHGGAHPMFACACEADYRHMDKDCQILFQDLTVCLLANGCDIISCIGHVPIDHRDKCGFRFE